MTICSVLCSNALQCSLFIRVRLRQEETNLQTSTTTESCLPSLPFNNKTTLDCVFRSNLEPQVSLQRFLPREDIVLLLPEDKPTVFDIQKLEVGVYMYNLSIYLSTYISMYLVSIYLSTFYLLIYTLLINYLSRCGAAPSGCPSGRSTSRTDSSSSQP